MTEIILHGLAPSSYTRTARMIAIEKGVPHTLQPIELKSPAHLARHPWGRIPLLSHGDVELIETVAIGHYLDAIGPGPALVPTTALGRAENEKWISIISSYAWDDLVPNYLFHYIFPKTADKQPDRAGIEKGAPAMARDLRLFESGFRGEWLTGPTLALADLFLAPLLAYVSMFPEGKAVLDTTPNLRRFLASISTRKSFIETIPPLPSA